MRRSFNKALLPKHPPEKSAVVRTGSAFNGWFRCILADLNVTPKEFAILIAEPYANVYQWRYLHNPQRCGQYRIASGLEKLGAGTYDDLRDKIGLLCASK
mgnify:CR=1 FL=1